MVDSQNENLDADGTTSQELEARYGREKPIEDWSTSTKCKVDNLVGSCEFRFCFGEEADGNVVFEGLQDTSDCIVQHNDFTTLTSTTNLKMAAPLLKDWNCKRYRKRAD